MIVILSEPGSPPRASRGGVGSEASRVCSCSAPDYAPGNFIPISLRCMPMFLPSIFICLRIIRYCFKS